VGSHVAALFMREGWTVKALIRRPDRAALLPAGVEMVIGDVREPRRYRRALADSDAVLHVAGIVKTRTLREYRSINADGAGAIARAAAEVCPAARFVLVSSQAAAGPAVDRRPRTESDPPAPVSWYGQSKLEGERQVESAFPGSWVIVRPSVVYGPGDNGLLEIFNIVARGWVPILAGGRRRVQLIAGHDLARVLYAAATVPGLTHRRGFAAVDTVTMGELARAVGKMRTKPTWELPIPALAIRLAGVAESVVEAVTGTSRPFNRDKAVEMLQDDWLCDGRPLLTDLGVTGFKPWKDGLLETCRWYVGRGWLPPAFNASSTPVE